MSDQECPDIDPLYWKADNNFYEQLGFTLLFCYSFWLFIFNIKNLVLLFQTRAVTSRWKLKRINITLLYMNLS